MSVDRTRRLLTTGLLAASTQATFGVAAALAAMPGAPLPSRPGRTVDVTEFGAKGDGRADDRAAIQRALDAGDGVDLLYVDIPPGRYRIGTDAPDDEELPLQISSHTLVRIRGSLLHNVNSRFSALLVTKGFVSRDIARAGTADQTCCYIVFDGGRILFPERSGKKSRKGIRFFGVTDFAIIGANFAGRDFSNFSLTIENCRQGRISGGVIEAGDDVGEDGPHLLGSCEDIVVSDLVVHSGDAALGMTQEGPYCKDAVMRNISVVNSVFRSARHAGLDIRTMIGTGSASIRNINISNCHFDVFNPAGKQPIQGQAGAIRCENSDSGGRIANVSIANCTFSTPRLDMHGFIPNVELRRTSSVSFKDCVFENSSGQLLLSVGCAGLDVVGCRFENAVAERVRLDDVELDIGADAGSPQTYKVKDARDLHEVHTGDFFLYEPKSAAVYRRIVDIDPSNGVVTLADPLPTGAPDASRVANGRFV